MARVRQFVVRKKQHNCGFAADTTPRIARLDEADETIQLSLREVHSGVLLVYNYMTICNLNNVVKQTLENDEQFVKRYIRRDNVTNRNQ